MGVVYEKSIVLGVFPPLVLSNATVNERYLVYLPLIMQLALRRYLSVLN